MALELQHTQLPNLHSDQDSDNGNGSQTLNVPENLQRLQRKPSIAPVPATLEAHNIQINISGESDDEEEEDVVDDEEIDDEDPNE